MKSLNNRTYECQPLGAILESVQVQLVRRRDREHRKITSNQLTTIFHMARSKNITQQELTTFIELEFNKPIMELTIQEASELIDALLS